jgi:3'-phosphoadenosine 5'-phosphosulfate (PAPS) 3'-phosphatase
MEWDTADGHEVQSAAGGRVTTRDCAPFVYPKPGIENTRII